MMLKISSKQPSPMILKRFQKIIQFFQHCLHRRKYLNEFFIIKSKNGYYLDCASNSRVDRKFNEI